MAFDTLYSPWRNKYFTSQLSDCIFCDISSQPQCDSKHYVFYRDSICFGVMNKYPYMPAHFMLIPHKHVDSPILLPQEEWLHICKLSQNAIALLEEYGVNGVNMGINIKAAAGAGIPKHLHLHFVPRYYNDTNFITTIGETRVYGMDFDKIFDKIALLAKKHFIQD